MPKVVKVFEDTYEELKKIQEEIYIRQGFRLTLGAVIDFLVKDWRRQKEQIMELGKELDKAKEENFELKLKLGEIRLPPLRFESNEDTGR